MSKIMCENIQVSHSFSLQNEPYKVPQKIREQSPFE